MKILVDTSTVVGFVALGQARHAPATAAVDKLLKQDRRLFLVPQVGYEFWVVATRPRSENGLGFSYEEASTKLGYLQEVFILLRDERSVFKYWKKIINQYQVTGKPAHDARLVAAMQRHRLTHLLTFNVSDFKRYAGIQVLEPQAVATQ